MSDDPKPEDETAELRRAQDERATSEHRIADADPTEAGTAKHRRRAEKADYLAEKLAERERAERG